MIHRIRINEKDVHIDDKQIRGTTDIYYHRDNVSVPYIDLVLDADSCDIEDLAVVDLHINPESVKDAIKVIQFEMKLDAEFRNAFYASARSAIEDIRRKSSTDLIDDYALAKAVIDRIVFGER